MAAKLLLMRIVGECFQSARRSDKRQPAKGMHCLGATAGQVAPSVVPPPAGSSTVSSSSSNSVANDNRNSALGLVRALGVLVCEGRIQGPPRGYKEGPHCRPPMQSAAPNDHACDKDNYLCDRYLVLVREIAERVDYLCVEVILCSDCPCGLFKSKSKHRLLGSQPPTAWQNSSEMLLEYWSVSLVPSKSPEMMNSQGLYQAVRSRLHFSQVAAWWSRTNGAKPSYIATRIVQPALGDEHLRRFRETPSEHTFPLAGLGDGNSIKVTVWALPRMEDIPSLHCPMHPDGGESAPPNSTIGSGAFVDGCTRAATPTKLLISGGMSPSTSPTSPAPLDGLADVMPGKFTSNPSTTSTNNASYHSKSSNKSGPATNQQQQQQQSSFVYFMSSFRSAALLDDRLHIDCDKPGKHHCSCADDEDDCVDEVAASAVLPARPNGERKRRRSLPCRPVESVAPQPPPAAPLPLSSSPAADPPALKETATSTSVDSLERAFRTQLSIEECGNKEKRYKRCSESNNNNNNNSTRVPPSLIPWLSYNCNGNAVAGSLAPKNNKVNLVVNPFCSDRAALARARHAELQQQKVNPGDARESSRQVAKLSLPARVSDLDLSPREFDEVLAVLRARTPLGRRRTALRTAKRREKYERLVNEQAAQSAAGKSTRGGEEEALASNKADVLLGAILRSSSKESSAARKGLADISNGSRSPLPAKSREAEAQQEASSGLNKRLFRVRQLFKRDQDKVRIHENDGCARQQQCESRAKRKIKCSASENGEEDEGEADDEGDDASCDSSIGTSTSDSAMFLSTTASGEEQQQAEACSEKMRKKTRGKRDLSPIWVNNNNNNNVEVEKSEPSDAETIDRTVVPSAKEQERFRRSLENAASMVFHSRTGLPLTSSPAPLRRGSCCFDFDSSLNSVSSKRSALFELNTPPSPGAVSLEEGDREIENVCDIEEVARRRSSSRNRPQSHALLGSFEESALNGRLEPVSTVHGFTAEIGASGSFCPKHRKLPVTVFFYTLGDNDKVSSPYLAHINLGKKGYQVPRSGTIQVTLLNPLGTVVKMFVVLYDLSDMPPRSHTFLRQRTLRDKTLRYLVHLRFMSGKSGRIYLHTDIRMIICRKSDVDTASDFGSEPPKELRSYIHGPTNPKFSPRC